MVLSFTNSISCTRARVSNGDHLRWPKTMTWENSDGKASDENQ